MNNKISSYNSWRNFRTLIGEINENEYNEKEIYFQNLKSKADFNITNIQKITNG